MHSVRSIGPLARLGLDWGLVRGLVCVLLLAGSSVGCAGNYHDTWTAENPVWVNTLPDRGTGLHETLAGLQEPTRHEYRLMVSRLAIVTVTESTVRELSEAEIASRLDAPPGDEDLAVVVNIHCRSKVDIRMYEGQHVSWLLLEGGKLSAWDLYFFGNRCVYSNDFQPASRESASIENQLRGFRYDRFPPPIGNPSEYYGKGLVYAREGRLAEAEEMLALGDRTFAARGKAGVRFSRPSEKVDLVTADDDAALRDQLVQQVDMLKGLEGATW